MAQPDLRQRVCHRDEELRAVPAVIDMDPPPAISGMRCRAWSGGAICRRTAPRSASASYNADLRQLLHVAIRVAARKR